MIQTRFQQIIRLGHPTPKSPTNSSSAKKNKFVISAFGMHCLLAQIRLTVASFVVVMGLLSATVLFSSTVFADYDRGKQASDAKRYQEALVHWTIAANKEDARAMLEIGRAYFNGLGVLQDYVEAYKWFNLAASRGISEAASERDAIAAEMSVEEKIEARKRSSDWKPDKAMEQQKVAESVTETPSAVAETPTPAKSMQYSRDAVREAQMLLAQLGYQPGSADGIWGPKTSSALQSFQRDAGMQVTKNLTMAELNEMRKRIGNSSSTQSVSSTQTDITDSSGSALFFFASIGYVSGLNFLLNAGIDVNATDEQGWTALMHAVKNGHSSTAKVLVDAEADIALQAPDGTTATSLAHDSQHTEFIQLLTGKDSTFSSQQQGRTVDDDVPSQSRQNNFAALMSEIFQGTKQKEKSLLAEEIKAFETEKGHKPSVRGVDENGFNDLHLAAALNLPNLSEALIREGINVSGHDRKYGATALHFANSRDGVETARILIAYGAELGRKDRHGKTPLHYAAQVDANGMAKLLIANGADFDARDSSRQTPLHEAAKFDSVGVAKILIGNGANLEAKDQSYRTPLNYAKSRSDVAYLLISNGASIF